MVLPAKQIRSKTKLDETYPKKNKRKQKQTKSQSYNKWAYQHVGLISESNMKSSQHVFCNIIGSKYYSSA